MSYPTSDPGPEPTPPWKRPDESPTTVTPWAAGPTSATAPTTQPAPRRRNRARWVVALLATALVVTTGIGVALFATSGQATKAVGPTYLPPTTVAYMEARLDLPGDQRDNLVAFMGKFPGFGDPANFELKINDALDRFTRQASQDRLTYSGNVEPWFEGEFSIAVTSVPEFGSDEGTGDETADPSIPFVGALGVSDRGQLESLLQQMQVFALESGAKFTQAPGNGATIVTMEQPEGVNPSLSYAVTDDLFLFAIDAEQLRTALDVRAGAQPSLAEAEPFKSQLAALPAQRLGAMYLDFAPFVDALGRQMSDAGMPGSLMDVNALPKSMVGALRVEGDRLALDMRMVPGSATPLPGIRDSGLAARMPATTAFYMEQRDLGQTARMLVTQLKTQAGPALSDSEIGDIEEFLGTPLEEFLSWVQDIGLGVSVEGERFDFGIVATVTDEAIAAQRVERITAGARAALAFGEDTPFEIVEETIAGAQVTTIRPKPGGGMLSEEVPFELSLSYTVKEGLFVLGVGDFVKGVLERPEGDSLASNGAYSTALDAAGGATNGGVMYVDIAALRAAIERMVPADQRAQYETDVRPNIEPLDRFVGVSTIQDGTLVVRYLLFVE